MPEFPCFAIFEIVTVVKPITLNLVAVFRTLDDAQTYITTNSSGTKTLLIKTLYMNDKELTNLVASSTNKIAYNF